MHPRTWKYNWFVHLDLKSSIKEMKAKVHIWKLKAEHYGKGKGKTRVD